MERWLTWRFGVPCAAVVLAFAYLAPPRAVDVALVLSAGLPIPSALRLIRKAPAARLSAICVALAQAFAVLMCLDRLVHDGTAGVVGSAAGFAAVVCYSVFSLGVLRARRPKDYLDGIVDGAAAAAGFVAIYGQYAALQPGATADSVAAGLTPFLGVFHTMALTVMFYGVARDPRQNILMPATVAGVSVLLIVATIGHASYSIADPPGWSTALPILSGFLIGGVFAHRDFPAMYQPEPPRRRFLQMRWIGPTGALMATPLLVTVFVLQGAVPTVGAGVVSAALTAVALWRGRRILAEREQSRRELLVEQRFRSLLERAADVIVILDVGRRVTYASVGAGRTAGSGAHLAGVPVTQLVHSEDAEVLESTLDSLPGHGETAAVPGSVRLRLADGETLRVDISVTNHCSTPGIDGWVLNIRDVTDRREAEDKLARLALEDPLTGLPNRASLLSRLQTLLNDAPGATAVLFCDLDGFKTVNDRLGHECGDEALRGVAGRWSALLRPDDVLGRWGGDEFLVLCPNLAAAADAAGVAERLVAALNVPLELAVGGSAQLGVSVGLALHFPGETADGLLSRADNAMYAAKRAAGGVRAAA